MRIGRDLQAIAFTFTGLAALLLTARTRQAMLPLPEVLPPAGVQVEVPRILDRDGHPLGLSFQNPWNVHDLRAFHEMPELLVEAFVLAEDKRFFEHGGVDWRARGHALWQNLWAGRGVRGASTISEQVVRILQPRPRTLWSKWVEGFTAGRLEKRFEKLEILEFYLNQVPYAGQRRGVVQAARSYFGRELETLSPAEQLALAVLVRSPSRLDPRRGAEEIRRPLAQLAERMVSAGRLSRREASASERSRLELAEGIELVEASHFARWVASGGAPEGGVLRTTLDGSLQAKVQDILDERLRALAASEVGDGAVLVVDHRTDEILAWVNGYGLAEREGAQIDKVLASRQPGSTLKPFVYGLALEKGWTAATLVEDAPLAEAVGHGLHAFRNYSRSFYGNLRLREALGNSLNTPAVRAVRYTGLEPALERLRWAGFETLTEHPEFYGDGLALGTGEVPLFDLVGAYASLARQGEWRELRGLEGRPPSTPPRRVFSPEVASLLLDILSDPGARQREFGRHSVLALPIPVAVKTGTSNDYRDAWTVGSSSRYTVGVWMGNVDRRPMLGISGSRGPALVLRAVFAELHRHVPSERLAGSRWLRRAEVCAESGALPGPSCPRVEESFRPGHGPRHVCELHLGEAALGWEPPGNVALEQPTPELHLAMDPRIPDELEAFEMRLDRQVVEKVEWRLDGELAAVSQEGRWRWRLSPGRHEVSARVWLPGAAPQETAKVSFVVKGR